MFNRTIFSKRFKFIRTSYNFSLQEFASIFKIISKSAVISWEKENNIPSADVLADLSTFFGISMDWFAGFSNIPYTKESIENAERNVLNKVAEIDKGKVFLYTFPKEYISCEQRENLYSLMVRANIIVLLHRVYIPHFESYWKAKEQIQNPTVIKHVTEEFKQRFLPPTYEPTTAKEKAYAENLFALLNRKITTPIYDIESGEIK